MELKEYLQQKYQGSDSFLKNVIFPTFGEDCYQSAYNADVLEYEPQLRPLAESTGIGRFIRIGTLELRFDSIEIFDITVVDHVQMARNRVAIQLLVRRIISTYSSAFMIFHYRGDTKWDWRFTFCRKGASNLESTDSKRFTFLLGPSQSCRTAADNFLKLSQKRGEIKTDDIVSAFDVEALSDEFFDKYKQHYESFVEYITGKRFVKKGNKWEERIIHEPHRQMYFDFGCDDKLVRDYVKKLMGRIVFLHFLQKKGWMGVPTDKEWGNGDLQFMKHLYDSAKEEQKDDFLDLVLEPLFVALDTNRIDNNFISDTITMGSLRIPYLNGGLFTRDDLDKVDTKFPKEMFEDLLEFLYQYNFTIDENDPGDAQVGIDPEMLGRIFENLLEDNKDKGAYYTPKEIVNYMCCESLKAYLLTDITDEGIKGKISHFVETYDVSEIDGGQSDLAKLIDDKLIKVKICDPAIGSGAFPMGLLKRLFFCRGAIEHFDNAADIKRHIIQNNIYGVDIERGAVDIARLRFWLSLIIDERTPETLPNLDFKIMQGNSLLESYEDIDLSKFALKLQNIRAFEPQKNLFGHIDDKDRQMNLTFTEHNIANDLSINLEKYYSEDDHVVRSKLHKRIEKNVRDQIIYNLEIRIDPLHTIVEQLSSVTVPSSLQIKNLTNYKRELTHFQKVMEEIKSMPMVNDKFFLWHTWFNDVFNRPSNSGFDIVIGNPPFIQLQNNSGELSLLYGKAGFKTYAATGDIYCLFYEQGWNLLKEKGHLCFITSNKWMRAGYGEKTRDFFANYTNPELMIDFAGVKIFESATVDTNILLFSKNKNKHKTICAVTNKQSIDYIKNLSAFVKQYHSTNAFISSKSWIILSPIEQSIKNKVEALGTPLKDWDIQINYGIKTGLNDAFIITTEKRDEILSNCRTEEERSKTAELIRPILRGRDIKRYGYEWANLWLIYIPWHFPYQFDETIQGASLKAEKAFKEQYLTVYNYLLQYKKQLSSRNKAETGIRYEWYALQRWGAKYWEDFSKPKVIYNDIAQRLSFALSTKGEYLNNTAYFFTSENHNILIFLLKALNSSIIDWYYRTLSVQLGESAIRMFSIYVLELPIPKTSLDILDSICDDNIINNIFFKLYGLTDLEIQTINQFEQNL